MDRMIDRQSYILGYLDRVEKILVPDSMRKHVDIHYKDSYKTYDSTDIWRILCVADPDPVFWGHPDPDPYF